MSTVYACTWADKEVEVDDFQRGCVGNRRGMFADSLNITADTLPALLKAIGDRYFLDLDDVWYMGDTTLTRIGYSRLETAEAEEPTPAERDAWQKGRKDLFLADYTFLIQKREVNGISMQEFKDAGIKTHD